ncbi:hypothetical protein QJS10_CPB15g01398 [Acorus calamus]|uniref:Secreted protein n=1 Tax=Acorus calamus TaxID=4465 RepID=A0AAV9D9C0_ACOCL|nr:hypothetical protein QJS10_CPB15g01398 [Acorus calamus]
MAGRSNSVVMVVVAAAVTTTSETTVVVAPWALDGASCNGSIAESHRDEGELLMVVSESENSLRRLLQGGGIYKLWCLKPKPSSLQYTPGDNRTAERGCNP